MYNSKINTKATSQMGGAKMKRCFYLTCEGMKQGYLVSKDNNFSVVVDLDGNELILKNWKVEENL